jgi:hypothetical protein
MLSASSNAGSGYPIVKASLIAVCFGLAIPVHPARIRSSTLLVIQMQRLEILSFSKNAT